MARKKAARGSRWRSAGMVGALAAALAGGGYYFGKYAGANGLPLPEKLAALIPSGKAAPTRETRGAEARAPETPGVKLPDKAELSRLLKGAESKLVATIRPEPEKRVKPPRTEANKTEMQKSDKALATKQEAKAAAARTQAAKAQLGKTQTVKAAAPSSGEAAAPLPPARIPDATKVDAAPTATIADMLARPDAAPAPREPAPNGASPLTVALVGKGIPTSEDSKMRLSVGFSNRTGKPIRAFEGVLKFTDLDDRSLFTSKISVSALIAEGGSINWDERVDPDKLDARGKKLVDADKDSLRAVFVPRKVFYVDGSVQQFGGRG